MSDENKPPVYTVPLLSVDGIIDALATGMLLQVKKTDLVPGNPEKLKEIYLVMLEYFHPNLAFISQQRFKDLGDMPPDEMGESVVALNIYGILKSVLAKMNYHDIFPSDVFIPSFKRTQVILSHLINAWRFIVTIRDEEKIPMRKKFAKHYTRKAALLADAPNIQRKLNDVAAKIVECQEATNELFQQQAPVRSEMMEMLAKKEAIQQASADKKALYTKLGQKNKTMQEALAELKVQNANLAEKVVNSPEHLEDLVKSRKQALAKLKVEIVSAKKSWNELVEHARNYGMWRTRVLALLKHTTAIKEEMMLAIKSKHEGALETEGQKQALRENIMDIEATYENLVASLKKLQDKDAMLKHQHHAKKNSLKTQLKEAQMSKKRIKKNVSQLEIAWAGANEEYNGLIVRMKQAKVDFKAAEKESKSHVETMAALDVYHNILALYLKDLEPIVDRLTSLSACEVILDEVRKAIGAFDKEGT